MNERRAILKAGDYETAPFWMVAYVANLVAVTNYSGNLAVLVAEDDFFANMPKSKGGATAASMMLEDGTDIIIMPKSAEATEFWHDALAHEFAHVLHFPIDRAVFKALSDIPDGYEDALETHVTMVGGFVQFAAANGTLRKQKAHQP